MFGRVILLMTMAALYVFLFLPTQSALLVTDAATERIVFARETTPNERFSIRFIHSVHRTPVEEFFRIDESDELVLERVEYESYGVGNPSEPEPGQRFSIRDGKLVIDGMDRRVNVIRQRIGQKVANHELAIDGRIVPFRSFIEPGSLVLIQVNEVSLWTLWKGGAYR